jgi:hypothetical protein
MTEPPDVGSTIDHTAINVATKEEFSRGQYNTAHQPRRCQRQRQRQPNFSASASNTPSYALLVFTLGESFNTALTRSPKAKGPRRAGLLNRGRVFMSKHATCARPPLLSVASSRCQTNTITAILHRSGSISIAILSCELSEPRSMQRVQHPKSSRNTCQSSMKLITVRWGQGAATPLRYSN